MKKDLIVPRVGVVVIEDDSLLLVKNDYGDGEFWLVPGGGVEFEESLEVCAVREVKEETGIDIQIEKFLYLREFIPNNKKDHVIDMFFLAKKTGGLLDTGNDPDHEKQVIKSAKFIPISKLKDIVLYPKILPDLIEQGLKNNFSNEPKFLGPC